MNSTWSLMSDEQCVDSIRRHLLASPEKWAAAWDAVQLGPYAKEYSPYDKGYNPKALSYSDIRIQEWAHVPSKAFAAALCALHAVYCRSALTYLLELTPDQLVAHFEATHEKTAILLLPATIAMGV